jgi:hypothetical protein
MPDARYYSLRRLSPYQGTVQIVERPGFRAISADGVAWQVHIQTGSSRTAAFATWWADGRTDLADDERTRPMRQALAEMPPLPFALVDRLELWLLDAHDRFPLALLGSTVPRQSPPPSAIEVNWQAGVKGDRGFVAPSLQTLASPNAEPPISHREVLNRAVRLAAGLKPVAQWFERDEHGHGKGFAGPGVSEILRGRRLPASAFPELLLRETWDGETETRLVRDYHDWHAPRLLTHGGLSRATRDRLEQAACRHAQTLYELRHLLGDILNPDLLNVAMVQAVMRQSASAVS